MRIRVRRRHFARLHRRCFRLDAPMLLLLGVRLRPPVQLVRPLARTCVPLFKRRRFLLRSSCLGILMPSFAHSLKLQTSDRLSTVFRSSFDRLLRCKDSDAKDRPLCGGCGFVCAFCCALLSMQSAANPAGGATRRARVRHTGHTARMRRAKREFGMMHAGAERNAAAWDASAVQEVRKSARGAGSKGRTSELRLMLHAIECCMQLGGVLPESLTD